MEIIKYENGDISQYEELLLQRDAYRKEAQIYFGLYLREFGDMMTEVFKKKIDCISLKKSIAYCQISANRGERVNFVKMQEFVAEKMDEYNKSLEDLMHDRDASKNITAVSEENVLRVKKTYRKIAKLIHPDLNDRTENSPELSELWNRVSAAYRANDLKEIEELEIFVNIVLETFEGNAANLVIPNLDEKLAALEKEIENIRNTDPYCYKYILEDKELVAEKHTVLKKELEEYSAYEVQLKEVLRTYLMNGVDIPWETN